MIGSAGAVYNRIFLTAAGTIIWGATSAGTALASSLAKVRSHLGKKTPMVVRTLQLGWSCPQPFPFECQWAELEPPTVERSEHRL